MKSFQSIYEEEERKHERENKQYMKFRGTDIEMLTIPEAAPLSAKYINNIPLNDKDIYTFINKLNSCPVSSFAPISFVANKLKSMDKTTFNKNLTDKDTSILKNYIIQFKNEVHTPPNHPLSIHVAKLIIDKLISMMK